MAGSEEELKNLLKRVKEESAKYGLKLNIKKLRSWPLVPSLTLRSLKAANNLLSLPPPQQTLCEVSGAERLQRSVTSPRSPSSCTWRSGDANPVPQITSLPLLTTTPRSLSLSLSLSCTHLMLSHSMCRLVGTAGEQPGTWPWEGRKRGTRCK